MTGICFRKSPIFEEIKGFFLMKYILFTYLSFSLIGTFTTACALLINKYFKLIYVKYFLYLFVTLSIIGVILMGIMSTIIKGNEKVIKVNKTNKLNSISINNAFNLMKMSSIVSYEGGFHSGIFRKYSIADIKMIFPSYENKNIDTKVVLWCYEHKISRIEKKDYKIYIIGKEGEKGAVYFTFIDSGIVANVESLFTLAK